MKKILNGKKYNTETAKVLGTVSYGYPNDFNWYEESLYQTKSGNFFIHGEGGASSKYAEKCGQNEWSGGEKIRLITVEAAQEWAEKNLDCDEYEAIFGEVEED